MTDLETLLQFLYLLPVGAVMAREDGTIELVNPTAMQLMLSLRPEEPPTNLFEATATLSPSLREQVAASPSTSGCLLDDVRLSGLAGDGRERVLSVSVHRAGQGRLMAVLHDLTRAVEQERQLAAAVRARTDFIASAGHELRTPLNGILGMAAVLRETPLDAEQARSLELLQGSAESLLSLTNQLLDFSKLEAGPAAVEHLEFDLDRTLRQSLQPLGLRAHQQGLELSWRLDPELPATLVGDPTRLQQVLVNLAGNALKFTTQGEVWVEVRQTGLEPGHALVEFSVSDTGQGIAPEKQQLIFEPFVQEHDSTSRTHGGTGLGLSISRRLVEALGGTLRVASTPGAGSRFFFTVPLGLAAASEPAATSTRPAGADGQRVLVVEPHPRTAAVLSEVLERWGLRPTIACDAAAARRETGPFAAALVGGSVDPASLATLAPGAVVRLTPLGTRGATTPAGPPSILKPVSRQELRDALSAAWASAPQAAPLSILLVEDNAVNEQVARRLLERRGHAVTVARDGHAAVALSGAQRFDLVLMDVHLPTLDGLAATAAIRRQEAGTTRHLRIIATTAESGAEEEARCRAAGMDAFLLKPFRPAELDRVLAR